MEESKITRDTARAAFKSSGLTYDVITPASMQRLRTLINERMKESGAIQSTFRCRQRGIVKETKWGRYGELCCKAYYFDNREAVTFNTDGFIGFAGWADDTNVQPILDGFNAWVNEMSAPTTPEKS